MSKLQDDIATVMACKPLYVELPADFAVRSASVEFDGHRFWPHASNAHSGQVIGDSGIALLELAYRARRGDESAALALNAFSITITDMDGRSYWPAGADTPAIAGGR